MKIKRKTFGNPENKIKKNNWEDSLVNYDKNIIDSVKNKISRSLPFLGIKGNHAQKTALQAGKDSVKFGLPVSIDPLSMKESLVGLRDKSKGVYRDLYSKKIKEAAKQNLKLLRRKS